MDEIGGGSDDDSLDYGLRRNGAGTTADNHEESEYDLDLMSMERTVRKRRCRIHEGEFARYMCLNHELVLCPRCLVSHKGCDF